MLTSSIDSLVEEVKLVGDLVEKMKAQAEADALDGRTKLVALANPDVVKIGGKLHVVINEQNHPVVTRYTRAFAQQKIYSIGSSKGREYIELDPESKMLQAIYKLMKNSIKPGMTTPEILAVVSQVSITCFKSKDVDGFIKGQLKLGKIVSLDSFIHAGVGVCRHHTLLNAYLLSKLVNDEILQGEVIHHRQNLTEGAHTWNLFVDKKANPQKVYSLDSLWNKIKCITDNPGDLNKIYRTEVESLIKVRYLTDAPRQRVETPLNKGNPIPTPKAVVKAGNQYHQFKEQFNEIKAGKGNPDLDFNLIFSNIKQYIEQVKFPVGDYLIFKGGKTITLTDGKEKRVPHRVAEIYNEIIKSEKTDEQKFKAVQEIVKDALNNPRPGRDKLTQDFYNLIDKKPQFFQEKPDSKINTLNKT